MGFLGDYFLQIKAESPGDRKIVFPRVQCEKWVKHFEFDESLKDDYYYIGNISISLSEEYFFFMMNENDFTNSKPDYSFENLLTKEEFNSLPIAVYAGEFYRRPHVFNSGWEETIHPEHLNTLNNALLRTFGSNEKENKKGILSFLKRGNEQNKPSIQKDAEKVKLFCEFAKFYYVRPTLITM